MIYLHLQPTGAAVLLILLISSIANSLMAASNATGCRATVQQLLQQMPKWKEMTAPGSHAVLSRIERCRTADFGYHAYRSAVSIAVAVLCNTSIIAAAIGIALVAV